MAGESFKQQGGLFIPEQTKRYCIFFYGGGRVTIEASEFEVVKEGGKLVDLKHNSKSKFLYLDPSVIQAIEEIA